MKITIQKITSIDFNKMGIANWPIWEKEVSSFDWQYDDEERFYVLDGQALIKAGKNEYQIGPGDFVICSKGLKCRWEISQPIKKHYQFFS
jgi:uncharacterized cupin superfamily protein